MATGDKQANRGGLGFPLPMKTLHQPLELVHTRMVMDPRAVGEGAFQHHNPFCELCQRSLNDRSIAMPIDHFICAAWLEYLNGKTENLPDFDIFVVTNLAHIKYPANAFEPALTDRMGVDNVAFWNQCHHIRPFKQVGGKASSALIWQASLR